MPLDAMNIAIILGSLTILALVCVGSAAFSHWALSEMRKMNEAQLSSNERLIAALARWRDEISGAADDDDDDLEETLQ